MYDNCASALTPARCEQPRAFNLAKPARKGATRVHSLATGNTTRKLTWSCPSPRHSTGRVRRVGTKVQRGLERLVGVDESGPAPLIGLITNSIISGDPMLAEKIDIAC